VNESEETTVKAVGLEAYLMSDWVLERDHIGVEINDSEGRQGVY
jgi:hypothetical protein